LKRRLALGAAVLISLGTVSLPAYADAPAQQGWWTSANPGSSAAVPVPSGGSGTGGPDVPANGLLVESAGSSPAPVAFAALTYDTPLPAGTAATLDLTVTAQSATTPGATLELCPLSTSTIQADQGGPMTDAPEYDCTTHVTAAVSSSGGSFHFDLAPLLNSAPLAVAILPTANVERVVLDQPSGSSLTVPRNTATASVSPAGGALPPAPASTPVPSNNASSAPSGPTGANVTPSAVGSVSATPTFGAATTGSPSPAGSTQSPALATPTAAATPTTQAGGAGTSTAAPVALGAATTAKSGASFPFAAILLIAGLVAVGSLWGYAGRAAVASKPQQTAESG
jgi:hypothetical protein